jgi:hypothetical protein
MIGRAAEKAQPADVKGKVRQADVVPFVQRLGGAVDLEITALQQTEANRVASELPREGNSRRAGAH